MTETRARLTAEELLHRPDDGKRYELIDGELIEMAPTGGEHGYVTSRAAYRLWGHVEQSGIGGAVLGAETGFVIRRNPDRVRAPDVAYVDASRTAQAKDPRFPEGAPPLVVEVVSPDDTARYVQDKVQEWLLAGAELVCVLYPSTRTAVLFQPGGQARVLGPDEDLTLEPVLPGFTCRVADLFPPPKTETE